MIQFGSDGGLKVNAEGMKTTYDVVATDIAVAATPTDIFTLSGSATTTVKVQRVEVAFSETTGSTTDADLLLILRSTADTTGTSTAVTGVARDSNNAAATAVAKFYTANPGGLGTAIGTIRAQKLALQTPTASINSVDSVIWDFGTHPGEQEVTLRGATQFLCVNGNGSAYGTSPSMSVAITFTEEPNTV